MTTETTLKMCGDIQVVVPDTLEQITTYVLKEQEDWFEDEIKFVRKWLKPGQRAIDIGANFGLYCLTMAKAVGPKGRIWAFEPASQTSAFLSKSIEANSFQHIVLDQRALSDKAGEARLSVHAQPELNQLVREVTDKSNSEVVTLTTLDAAMDEYAWLDIDFIKIDAEGEEAAIIRGGARFFATLSPLVQFEVKAVHVIHFELIHAFEAMGYNTYRLLPGLNVLIPFEESKKPDAYLLNLFCCKPDRAAAMANAGYLVTPADFHSPETKRVLAELLPEGAIPNKYHWQEALSKLPYVRTLLERWRETVASGQSREVEQALALHAVAHDSTVSLPARVHALRASLFQLKSLCTRNSAYLRYTSLARVAREYGERQLAVDVLKKLAENGLKTKCVDPSEPFLAVGPYFDHVDPAETVGNWVLGSALEEIEKLWWFSSYFSDASTKPQLKLIERLKFGSPEMRRRLQLLESRHAKPTSLPQQ